MWGAAVLSAAAAARSGSGYVYIFDFKAKNSISKTPDYLFIKRIKNISQFNAIAIGPGLSSQVYIRSWLKKIKTHSSVVVDASALDCLAKLRFKLPSTWILTPHEGELARMLGVSSKVIRANREKYILIAQKKFGCIVLLKGHTTLIADGKTVYQIKSGNAALAKAGTGDVLTGMITGFLSQGLRPVNAAALAAFSHGYMADRWVKSGNDILSLLASDLVALLPQSLRQIRD